MLNLIKAELTMLYGELKNYYVNYIFFNISILVTFVGLFYAFPLKDKQSSLILLIALVAWQLCNSALGYIGYVVQDESILGTLEQIFMTRTKVTTVFFSKILVNGLFNLVKALIIFFICIFVFNVKTSLLKISFINSLEIIFFIIVTVFSFYILGLVFGGLSLFLKRIHSVIGVITYFLLFFTGITIKIESLPCVLRGISYTLPITWLNKIIYEVVTFKSINMNTFIFFTISCLVFIFLGCYVFFMCINKAKKLGKLGQY
ncbi:ABC transporter permease (plasmid) [Haloimpatiens sp. FM7330]|uniref:ABC transporter permease n=1 Tax=Haloimpatiens sp. FM7330 TaxID=3298610 RepID=UPI00362D9E00